jgi:hypothetical protein
MTNDRLTAILAERVMGWRVTGDRFLMGNRRWAPRWRFQPASKIADAIQLLQKAAPEEFAVKAEASGAYHARTRIGGRTGMATDKSQARAITYAVARALGINLHDGAGRGDADGI